MRCMSTRYDSYCTTHSYDSYSDPQRFHESDTAARMNFIETAEIFKQNLNRKPADEGYDDEVKKEEVRKEGVRKQKIQEDKDDRFSTTRIYLHKVYGTTHL